MILLDTNIISTFFKIEKFELLYNVFNKKVFYISPNVFIELKKAKNRGFSFIGDVFGLINKGKLKVAHLTQEEMLKTVKLPNSLSAGEKDSIVICKERKAVFVTNERKVINYCKREGIAYFDLRDILKALYEFMDYSKSEINSLIDEIEEKDNLIIKNREEIFI